jgi:RNA polymerase sigma-70 factor (ECF subfamily)
MDVTELPIRTEEIQPLSREDELALLDALLEGNQEAWKRFHQQYDRLMYRCIRKVVQSFASVLRSEDEREIYANLMLQLLANDKRKLRCFDPSRGSRLGTWLGLLATNAGYDYLRSLRREAPRVPLSEADSVCATSSISPFELVERKERREIVEELLSGLSDKDRQFVTLYFSNGLSPEAVAEAMNISIKTVYSKKHKIRTRLECIVAQQGPSTQQAA